MDSSLFVLSVLAGAIGFFMLLRKLRFHQDNYGENSSSSSLSHPFPSSVPTSSSSPIWTYHVFTSFRGEEVRRNLFSHIQTELQRNGITLFDDNEIPRGEYIGPELLRAIRGSKIAIILLSTNYASSKWCLDELVEIIKCREELGQTVMTIFYKVDPSDVKKLSGEFGKVFRKTCSGKTEENIRRWKQALAKVPIMAGYHSTNWENDAAMIKKIATDISNKLKNSTSPSYFVGLVGMRAHLEKMEPLLRLCSITRFAYDQLSNSFQPSVFVENVKAKLQLQQRFMSKTTNQKNTQDRLKDERILAVLDGSVQQDPTANETSLRILTTQDPKPFRAHGINHHFEKMEPLFHQDNNEENSSSCSHPSSSSRIRTYDVFSSFRGIDIRKGFFSHIQKEFLRKGIMPFVDNEIQRGEPISFGLIRAIRESKIAVILLSSNYASSSSCLDELVEIMRCREELGQTVVTIFYKVDPSDVKKQTGDFGNVFRKTCAGQTKEAIGRWRQALTTAATMAGYHLDNWENEAAMVDVIVTDIADKLNRSVSSNDFDGLVGMKAHLEKMEPLLCLDSNDVRMIGIWGPPGIGKTTIAQVAYEQLSNRFQQRIFVKNIKASSTRLSSIKLQLQQQFASQITNHEDTDEVSAQDMLKDKKVLAVFDGVDQLVQLDTLVKETRLFGPGSRIIITTQDQRLCRAHGINHIYKVEIPPTDEALRILCMSAFGQKYPQDGFEELALEVTQLAGNLPLGLKVMGSHFRGMSKQEWRNSLRLRTSMEADIRNSLKLSYDALRGIDKDLFLQIACSLNSRNIKEVEEQLANKFLEVRQRLNVLADKSLISINYSGGLKMHRLLEELGREIFRKQRKILVSRL